MHTQKITQEVGGGSGGVATQSYPNQPHIPHDSSDEASESVSERKESVSDCEAMFSRGVINYMKEYGHFKEAK